MSTNDEVQQLSLEASATHLLEECRMVLPGVQALFGFQFIAVFNQAFGDRLSSTERMLHLAALLCTACSAALVMSPAALHRHTQPRSVSSRFLAWSSSLLMWSMAPLALGTSLDVYVVSRLVTNASVVAGVIAASVCAMFLVLWVAVPMLYRINQGQRRPADAASRAS